MVRTPMVSPVSHDPPSPDDLPIPTVVALPIVTSCSTHPAAATLRGVIEVVLTRIRMGVRIGWVHGDLGS